MQKNLQVSNCISSALQDCRACLMMGGDHSLATGSIHGHISVAGII